MSYMKQLDIEAEEKGLYEPEEKEAYMHEVAKKIGDSRIKLMAKFFDKQKKSKPKNLSTEEYFELMHRQDGTAKGRPKWSGDYSF